MRSLVPSVAFALACFAATPASAVPIVQYATTVVGYSSQWSSGSWSAQQALGAPNTPSYGDFSTAWAPQSKNGTLEYLHLGFDSLVYATGISIWESFGNGFVTKLELFDTADARHTIWTGIDPSQPGSVVEFSLDWALTDYLVKAVMIHVDTDLDLGAYEEITAVQLRGVDESSPTRVPEPATLALIGVGLAGLGLLRRRRA